MSAHNGNQSGGRGNDRRPQTGKPMFTGGVLFFTPLQNLGEKTGMQIQVTGADITGLFPDRVIEKWLVHHDMNHADLEPFEGRLDGRVEFFPSARNLQLVVGQKYAALCRYYRADCRLMICGGVLEEDFFAARQRFTRKPQQAKPVAPKAAPTTLKPTGFTAAEGDAFQRTIEAHLEGTLDDGGDGNSMIHIVAAVMAPGDDPAPAPAATDASAAPKAQAPVRPRAPKPQKERKLDPRKPATPAAGVLSTLQAL